MAKLSETSKGIILIILSAFFFALMALFVRLAGDLFFIQKAFFRNAVSLIIALISITIDIRKNGLSSISITKQSLLYLFLRSIAGSVGIFGNFYAIDHLVLSDASILNKMAPFFAILFSFFLMKEKIKPVPLAAIITAFLGSLLIIKPSLNFTKMIPTLAGFLSGVGAGFAYSCVRKLGTLNCKGKIVVLFFSAFSTLLCLPFFILNYTPMTWQQLLFLICAGACGAGGQFTITAAYYHAPASRISIYDYTQIIFSTTLGFIFFGMIPDVYSFIGYAIIISMALLNFFYNKHIQKRNQQAELSEKSAQKSE